IGPVSQRRHKAAATWTDLHNLYHVRPAIAEREARGQRATAAHLAHINRDAGKLQVCPDCRSSAEEGSERTQNGERVERLHAEPPPGQRAAENTECRTRKQVGLTKHVRKGGFCATINFRERQVPPLREMLA